MDRTEALQFLASKNSDDRLRAARYLGRHGHEDDVATILNALNGESNRWAKSAMQKAVKALRRDKTPSGAQIGAEGEEDRIIDQIYADAVEETTQRLVHEIRPIIGRLDFYASKELPNYEGSKTKTEFAMMQALLVAIDLLGRAAAAPVYKEFDFVELLERVITAETHKSSVKIETAGTRPFVILGASDLVQLIMANAIRNALEATELLKASDPVVINWGATERDYWFAVLDRGCGLPPSIDKVFEIGSTTKKGHIGMGLALASQAALTLHGSIFLSPREPRGARFEFRWPHVAV